MRPSLASLLAFIGLATSVLAAPAPAARVPASPAAVATIPLDTDGASAPFIRGRVRGTPFWFLLDTASPSSFGRKQAQVHGLTNGPDLRDLAIELPGITVTMPSFALADLDPRQLVLGHRLDGVLGSEFFARFVATFDFQRKTLTLRDQKTSRSAARDRALPLTVEGGLPYIRARVTPRGAETLDGQFLVDTAAEGAVTLFSPFVARHHLLGPPPTAPAGSGGAMQAVIRGETLDLGGRLLREPVITLSTSTSGIPSDGSDGRHAGLIGLDVLRRFKVTLDLSRKRLLLEKNSAFPEPFDYDASGLRVQATGADLTTLQVRSVRPGSPGALAGLRAGDVILAVDGRPVGAITLHGVRRLFQKDGKEYALSILREGAIRKLQLQCRRQI